MSLKSHYSTTLQGRNSQIVDLYRMLLSNSLIASILVHQLSLVLICIGILKGLIINRVGILLNCIDLKRGTDWDISNQNYEKSCNNE